MTGAVAARGHGQPLSLPIGPVHGGFLPAPFTFGHVRQLGAVASRVLRRLGDLSPVLAGIDEQVILDIDDTIIEVHGHTKAGSGYGYSGVRGLNALLATATTDQSAPVIVGATPTQGLDRLCPRGDPVGQRHDQDRAPAALTRRDRDRAGPGRLGVLRPAHHRPRRARRGRRVRDGAG